MGTTAETGSEPLDIGPEVPEADAIEQHLTAVPEEAEADDVTDVPWDTPEADLLDQRRAVFFDDELRADEPGGHPPVET